MSATHAGRTSGLLPFEAWKQASNADWRRSGTRRDRRMRMAGRSLQRSSATGRNMPRTGLCARLPLRRIQSPIASSGAWLYLASVPTTRGASPSNACGIINIKGFCVTARCRGPRRPMKLGHTRISGTEAQPSASSLAASCRLCSAGRLFFAKLRRLPPPAVPGSGRTLRPPFPGSSPGYGATRSRLPFPPRRGAVSAPTGNGRFCNRIVAVKPPFFFA